MSSQQTYFWDLDSGSDSDSDSQLSLTDRQQYHNKRFFEALEGVSDELKEEIRNYWSEEIDCTLDYSDLVFYDKCMLLVDVLNHAFKFKKPQLMSGLLLFVGMFLMALTTPYNGIKFVAKDIKGIFFNILFWAMGALASFLIIYSIVKPVVGYIGCRDVNDSPLVLCTTLSREIDHVKSQELWSS